MVTVEVKQWGNSLGVILPIESLRAHGVEKGDLIELDIVAKKRIDAFGLCKGASLFTEEDEGHEEF